MEKWFPIEEFGGDYLVSSTGRVFSKKASKSGKILSPKVHHSGYLMVSLSKDGKVYNRYIHRLVATAFVGNPNSYDCVNHKDGDKHNNYFENLEWVTPSQNIRHSFNVLGKKSPMYGKTGKLSPCAKPVYQISLDGEIIKRWDCVSDAARAFKCNPAQIINVIAGRGKTCKGYKWAY